MTEEINGRVVGSQVFKSGSAGLRYPCGAATLPSLFLLHFPQLSDNYLASEWVGKADKNIPLYKMTPKKVWSLTLERVEGSGAAVFFNQPALNPIHNHNKCSWIGINFKILNGDGRYNRKPLLTPFFAMLSVEVYNCRSIDKTNTVASLKNVPTSAPLPRQSCDEGWCHG